MNFFVAITDYDWFQLHAAKTNVDEVNFWRPSSGASFKALQMGEPFLFKLHAPRHHIVGGGFFTKFLTLPVSLAWDAFGESNGARSLDEVKQRISQRLPDRFDYEPISPRSQFLLERSHQLTGKIAEWSFSRDSFQKTLQLGVGDLGARPEGHRTSVASRLYVAT
jgi:hypothetical protein